MNVYLDEGKGARCVFIAGGVVVSAACYMYREGRVNERVLSSLGEG